MIVLYQRKTIGLQEESAGLVPHPERRPVVVVPVMLGLELSLDEAPEGTQDVLDQNIHLEPLIGTRECFVHPSFLSN